ncbi:MAG TPA: ABC transporter ATP-binding protein, partial [Candidatus Acetothermia bacterium]|nr:ABC transporter ATP-binding protein [Candidatus Acetothermia bacterium]
MTSSAFLTVSELVKRFGEVVAINHVNLEIDPGEFFVLLGPSGCGKTTLLRCIAGLEQPDEGRIVIGDKTVFSSDDDIVLPPGRRNVDMVFQSYALWPHMSTFENIAFGLKLKKMSHAEIKRRVDQVLSDLGMDGLQKRFPFELSGGQQQRVALARLLANQPPVFLMDEPLSNLDARLRLDMRSELKRLHHDAGATTVYVTHDQTEALTMASRVVVMDKGVIQQIAPPEELYATPANLF